MRRDGRFEPLTVIAQIAALVSVVATALVAWIRHEPPAKTPPHTFITPKTVETPWRHP